MHKLFLCNLIFTLKEVNFLFIVNIIIMTLPHFKFNNVQLNVNAFVAAFKIMYFKVYFGGLGFLFLVWYTTFLYYFKYMFFF